MWMVMIKKLDGVGEFSVKVRLEQCHKQVLVTSCGFYLVFGLSKVFTSFCHEKSVGERCSIGVRCYRRTKRAASGNIQEVFCVRLLVGIFANSDTAPEAHTDYEILVPLWRYAFNQRDLDLLEEPHNGALERFILRKVQGVYPEERGYDVLGLLLFKDADRFVNLYCSPCSVFLLLDLVKGFDVRLRGEAEDIFIRVIQDRLAFIRVVRLSLFVDLRFVAGE